MSEQELLTVKQIAELLKVTPATIYRWLDSGKLPRVKFSRRAVRVRRDDLERFVKDHLSDQFTRTEAK